MNLKRRLVGEFIERRMLSGQVRKARIGTVYIWTEKIGSLIFIHVGTKEAYEEYKERHGIRTHS